MSNMTTSTDNANIDSANNDTGIYALNQNNLVSNYGLFPLSNGGYKDSTTAVDTSNGLQATGWTPSPVVSYLSNTDGTNFDMSTLSYDPKTFTIPDVLNNPYPPNGSAGINGYDYKKYQELQQQAQDDKRMSMYGGFGLGTVQLGLGIYNAIGQNQLNQKNMQLMDQQIANNKQVMSDRTQRNADIAKAFGSNGVMSKPTGL